MASSITIVGFDEVPFPRKIEFGMTGGPGWNTTVIITASGFEQRNQNWENARRRFDAIFKQLPSDPFNSFPELLAFFNARRGRLRGFRFRDHTDFEAIAQVCTQFNDTAILVGDGVETEFQCAKLYDDANQSFNPFRRLIKKPVLESPDPDFESGDPTAQVFLDTGGGPVLQARPGDYSFDTSTGKITFTVAPVTGDVVTWTGEFDVPVRFDTDDLDTTLTDFDNFVVPVVFIELRIPQG